MKQIIFFHSVPVWRQGRIASANDPEAIAARQQLEGALENHPSNVDVRIEITPGRPNEAILELLKTYPIDILLTIPPYS